MMQQLTMETLWAEISNVPGSASVMQKRFFLRILSSCEWNFFSQEVQSKWPEGIESVVDGW